VERHVAFLRGMNLGGRRIKNEELRREFEVLGLAGVSCFRASGNVIFVSEEGNEDALTRRIESGLEKALGYEVPVFLRSATELGKIVAREPFDAGLVEASKGKLQVAFLAAAPKGASRKRALELSTGEDRLAIAGRELHWLPSVGISESSLDLKSLEDLLGPWTMRTMDTVEQIVVRHFVA
jgi:uncharacterized protein (DUF1697 family)